MAAVGIGIPQLEALLAPIPRHAMLLFMNEPGVEPDPFLFQAAHEHLAAGGTVVYAVSTRPPEATAKAMRGFGFDPDTHADRLLWVDAYSPLMGLDSGAPYRVGNPADPREMAATFERAAREHPGAMLVVDSLSQLADQLGYQPFLEALPHVQDAMRGFQLTAAGFTRWPYGDDLAPLSRRFDAVVTLRGVEDRVMLSQFFRVDHARWKPELDAKPRMYKALKPGGVHVYIPKIVVTGPYNAGKSSFVQALSDAAVSVDHLGTTVALDHGRATMDGLTAEIFGTPGQSRFDPILRVVAGQALGVIVVVDATKPESFARAREMLDLTWRKSIPGIIAANKQDMPDALPPEEVARLIGPPPTVRVVGCVGNDPASARGVLKELIDQILAAGVEA